MITPPSTFLAERLILIVCWSIFCMFLGQWVLPDRSVTRECVIKKQSINMTTVQQKRWINYYLKGNGEVK